MKVRIKFRKYGVMKYIGHLDLMRYFQKAIRRAGLDIRYSEGFHPHMIMSFAAPIGVGMLSDGEYFDIEMHSSPEPEEAIRLLNEQMAEGMEVTAYVPLSDDAKKSMALVEAARYRYLYQQEAERKLSPERIRTGLCDFYEQAEAIPVTKKTKKSERTLDLKPLIYEFFLADENGCPVSGSSAENGCPISGSSNENGCPVSGQPDTNECSGCGLPQDAGRIGFELLLSAGSTDNVKPELVLEAFYRSMEEVFDPLDFERRRIEVYTRGEDGRLIPLEEFQKKPQQTAGNDREEG